MKKILIISISILFLAGCSSEAPQKEMPVEKNTVVEVTEMGNPSTSSGQENLENLDSFEFIRKTSLGENEYIYSYTPINEDDFSVAMTVSEEGNSTFKEQYSLEKEIIDINSIQVEKGFTEEEYMGGIFIYYEYASLAFDFKINNKFYSGEITNLNSESSKEKLLAILEKLVTEINILDSAEAQ